MAEFPGAEEQLAAKERRVAIYRELVAKLGIPLTSLDLENSGRGYHVQGGYKGGSYLAGKKGLAVSPGNWGLNRGYLIPAGTVEQLVVIGAQRLNKGRFDQKEPEVMVVTRGSRPDKDRGVVTENFVLGPDGRECVWLVWSQRVKTKDQERNVSVGRPTSEVVIPGSLWEKALEVVNTKLKSGGAS